MLCDTNEQKWVGDISHSIWVSFPSTHIHSQSFPIFASKLLLPAAGVKDAQSDTRACWFDFKMDSSQRGRQLDKVIMWKSLQLK